MEDAKIEQNLNDLIEIVSYIKDNMATKDDIARLEKRMDSLEIRIDRLEKRIDSIESRINSIESKLIFISEEIQQIRIRLDSLENRTKEDDEAIVKDIFELRQRVQFLEEKIQRLEAAKA